MRKKTIKFSLIALVIGVNLFGLHYSNRTLAATKDMKGMLGYFQGIQVCHCPDDKGNCICRIISVD
jgi:hypothetical protein